MGKSFLHSFEMASVRNMTAANFAAEMRKFKGPRSQNNRIAVSYRLASREVVDVSKFIIDHEGTGFAGHVTIAVCDVNGLQAVEDVSS